MWPFRRKVVQGAPLREAIGNFRLSAQLAGSSGKVMEVSGYIYSDDDHAALNARVDLYQTVMERQRARCEIPELEAKLEQMLNGVEQANEHLAALKKKRDTGENLSSQERMQIGNMSVSIQGMLKEAEKGRKAIAEKKVLAGLG